MPSWLSARNTTAFPRGRPRTSVSHGASHVGSQIERTTWRARDILPSPPRLNGPPDIRQGQVTWCSPNPAPSLNVTHVLILPGQLSCAINQVCSHVLHLRTALGKDICHKVKDLSHLLKISFQEFDLTLSETHTPNWNNSLVLFIFFSLFHLWLQNVLSAIQMEENGVNSVIY